MLDNLIKRLKQLCLSLVLLGSFGLAVSVDRTNLLATLAEVERETFAYLLLESQLGSDAIVDTFDDDFLHIREPGDDDFLKTGTIPDALLGVDLFFGGIISRNEGANQYRFENGLSVLLEDNEVRTYYAPDAEKIGLEYDGGFIRIGGSGDNQEVVISVNGETGDLTLTEFRIWRVDKASADYSFWLSDGYFLQDYGGGEEEKFEHRPRIVGDGYRSENDIALRISFLTERWLDHGEDPHEQYLALRRLSEQQKFNLPILGFEGDVSTLQQVLSLIVFVVSVLAFHASLGVHGLARRESPTEPWILIVSKPRSGALRIVSWSLWVIGAIFFGVALALGAAAPLVIGSTFEISPIFAGLNANLLPYISIPLLFATYFLGLISSITMGLRN